MCSPPESLDVQGILRGASALLFLSGRSVATDSRDGGVPSHSAAVLRQGLRQKHSLSAITGGLDLY